MHIEQIIADDKPYDLKPGMRLPANSAISEIEYTALSLVAPEKIHFKYKLEGQDRNWHGAINRPPRVLYESSASQLPLPRHGLEQ